MMDNNELKIYEVPKIKSKMCTAPLFIFSLVAILYSVILALFPFFNFKIVIGSFITILIFGFFLLYLSFSKYTKYDKIGFSEKTKTISFIKNNEIKKIVSCNCISKLELCMGAINITSIDGEKYFIVLDNDSLLNLYNQIKNEYIEKPNNTRKLNIKGYFYGFFLLFFILFCIAVLFNSMNCSCNKKENICTIDTYEFFSQNRVVFKINDLQDVKIKMKRSGKHSFDEVHILLKENGIEYTLVPEISFYLPFFAEYFKSKLLDYKNGDENIFEYNYITPLVAVGIFIFIYVLMFCFNKNKTLSKNITLIISVISLLLYLFIASNYKIEKNPNLIKEKEYISLYKKAEDFLFEDKIDDALYFYDKAEKIYSDDYVTSLDIGEIYIDKKNYKKALEYILKSIDLNERNEKSIVADSNKMFNRKHSYKTRALVQAANIYKSLDDCNNAVVYQTKLLNEATNLNEFSVTRRKRAECYLKLNKKEEAFSDYVEYKKYVQEQIKKNPNAYNAKNLVEIDSILMNINKEKAKSIVSKKLNNADNLYSNFQKIQINNPSEYDDLTKQQIFDLRKDYVSKSIFSSKWYKPNEEIFGGIEDKKPWYGIDNNNCPFVSDVNKGMSARSIIINNPAMLVGVVNHLGYKYPSDTPFCKNEILHFIPNAIYYNKEQKTIVVVYKVDNSVIKNIQEPQYIMPLSFIGLNARDFGYKYAIAQNKYNIYFTKPNNVSKEIYEFLDYLHVGHSCKLPGGCNNVSPLQPELEFRIKELPAGLTFKLWKRTPRYKAQKADMNLKVIFEEIDKK